MDRTGNNFFEMDYKEGNVNYKNVIQIFIICFLVHLTIV